MVARDDTTARTQIDKKTARSFAPNVTHTGTAIESCSWSALICRSRHTSSPPYSVARSTTKMNRLSEMPGATNDVTGQRAESLGCVVYQATIVRLMTAMEVIARKGASRTIDRK